VSASLVNWLGRCLLHERTRALILEPALADLTFETTGTAARWRRQQAQLGPWVAFVLAIWHDIVSDPRGPAWGRSVRVLATLAFVVACYHASMLTLILGFETKWRTGVSHQLAAAVSGQSVPMLTVAAFAFGVAWAARRAHSPDGH
jgi:hypothetical protein